MINRFLTKGIGYLLIISYIIINGVMIYFDHYYLLLLPFLLGLIYLFIYRLDLVFLLIVFCTPLSFNFENLAIGGIGFYFPTEPLLLTFSVVFLLKYLLNHKSSKDLIHYKNHITIIILLQLIWIIICSITSELPIVSMKFFISRAWFIIPMFFYAIHFFKEGKHRISQFLWAYLLPVFIVTTYTLLNHMSHGFSEEAGHWVMWPFFKDHTSYGAIIALSIPIALWLYKSSQNPINKFLIQLIIIVLLVGLYFSYTRAAWLSVIGAVIVYFLFYFKIKLKWLITIGVIPIFFIALNYSEISYLLQKNDAEHTTENFSERVESMSNVSSDASNLERLNRWNCAFQLFKERPITGWGPGTYSFVYAPFQDASDITIISTNFGDGGNAHSEYLGPLAEQGLIGMILMITLVCLIFIYMSNYQIKCDDSFQKKLVLMIILALTTYFTHGILNNYLDTDKASVPVWGLIALFVSLKSYSSKQSKSQLT